MTQTVRGVNLTGWGAYTPSLVLTNADLEKMVETSDEWIITRTGIRERRIAGPTETTASMGAAAALRAIAVAGLEPQDLDLIVLCTLTPDFPLPSTATLLKQAIGNTKAAAFDLSAACSGFVYGYVVAHSYLASGLGKHALVVGSETMSRCTDFTDRSTCVLFGDGAGAVVLSATGGPGGTLGVELTTDTAATYSIWIPGGASARPATAATLTAGEHYMRMKGGETFKLAVRKLTATTMRAVENAAMSLEDVDLVIPHQANARIIEATARALGIQMEKVFLNVDRYGNTSAATVPIAITEAVASGRIKRGDKVVLVAFGAGGTSGAVALEWTADPADRHRAESVPGGDVPIVNPGIEPADPFPPALRWMLDRPSGANGRNTGLDLGDTESVNPGAPSGATVTRPQS
jgi:3-oxoacyl-[acyl-carrier-protein] synthase-3